MQDLKRQMKRQAEDEELLDNLRKIDNRMNPDEILINAIHRIGDRHRLIEKLEKRLAESVRLGRQHLVKEIAAAEAV